MVLRIYGAACGVLAPFFVMRRRDVKPNVSFDVSHRLPCLNVRVKEHKYKVSSVATDGQLVAHCKKCISEKPSFPLYDQTIVLYFHRSPLARKIVEAAETARSGYRCVSRPSVAL